MRSSLVSLLVVVALLSGGARGAELVVDRWLVIEAPDERGRRPFEPSAVVAAHLLRPSSPPPRVGDVLVGERGVECAWRPVEPDSSGHVPAAGAWAYGRLEHDADEVVLARLTNASRLWVNGERVTGDVYGMGFGPVPVRLREGTNHLFVGGVRGAGFELSFERPGHDLLLPAGDDTIPTLAAGAPIDAEASLLVVNASRFAREGVVVEVLGDERIAPGYGALDDGLPPRGVAKVVVPIVGVGGAAAPSAGRVTVRLRCGDVERTLSLDVVPPDGIAVHTFRSAIDGSLQPYALVAPTDDVGEPGTGLVVTLHGAGVPARNQAAAYRAKPDLWLLAPTNRRPFGFDWQDWGRLDAYEALDHALARTGADPARISLTGHSMGGHGVWHLAVNDADGFAAIGPSAGWASFDSYGARRESPRADVWHGADAASATHELVDNLDGLPIYVLHGEHDDSVPLDESRALSASLSEHDIDHVLHVQPDVGHWWDGDRSDGVDCVDWPPMFELFERARRPGEPDRLAVTFAAPWLERRHHWIVLDDVLDGGRPATVDASWDATSRTVTVRTDNVARLTVDVPAAWTPAAVVLDGAVLAVDAAPPLAFAREADAWRAVDVAPPRVRGPFKAAFMRPFVLVVGTAGDDLRDAGLLARARDDATQWWYRGGGRAPVVTDEDFLVGSFDGRWRDRNVVLYGNALTNRAWSAVLGPDCPVDVVDGALRVGDERHDGEALAALFVRPRADVPGRLVAAFAGTGPIGDRLTGVVPVFVSGIGVPDYVVFDETVLRRGDDGVLAAGFFAPDGALR